jgi:hypothetical protein
MYEYHMQAQCRAGCYRIELLLVLPVLLGASMWAVIVSLIGKSEKQV